MQATVHVFDPTSRTGSVVTDGGVLIPLAPEAFEESALRTLRSGQRLTVEISGRGTAARVTRIAIETVGQVPARGSRP
jgi:hypothetical protein